MNPLANALDPWPNKPPRFRQQLLSIVCHRPGRIETIDPNSRVWSGRQNGTRKIRLKPWTCGIEERLIRICLEDSDVGSLISKDHLFEENPNYPEPNLDHVMNHYELAVSCEKFFIIDLPSLRDNDLTLRAMSEIILHYLRGGQTEGFNRVMMNGLGLGEACQPEHLGWENFDLNDLVRDDFLRRHLLGKTTNEHRPAWNNRHAWFFCRKD